ncbi:hypothetical protein FRB90_006902 [Tulasnella sp. 427]|nr:hypothetical protein FRB90_006902 [Tulasnella sp. 427]
MRWKYMSKLSYRDLQIMARSWGIKANGKRAELQRALYDRFKEPDDEDPEVNLIVNAGGVDGAEGTDEMRELAHLQRSSRPFGEPGPPEAATNAGSVQLSANTIEIFNIEGETVTGDGGGHLEDWIMNVDPRDLETAETMLLLREFHKRSIQA